MTVPEKRVSRSTPPGIDGVSRPAATVWRPPSLPGVEWVGSPVMALAIIDSTGRPPAEARPDSPILLGIRCPQANATHPNVVSVPTQRVPGAFLLETIAACTLVQAADAAWFFTFPEVTNTRENGHHPVIFLIESVLSRKLGVAQALERGEIEFTAGFFSLTTGIAHYGDEGPYGTAERMVMGNLWVAVTRGFDRFPGRTESFSRVFAATLEALDHAKATGDITGLAGGGLDPAVHSIGGVCIASTINALRFHLADSGNHRASAR